MILLPNQGRYHHKRTTKTTIRLNHRWSSHLPVAISTLVKSLGETVPFLEKPLLKLPTVPLLEGNYEDFFCLGKSGMAPKSRHQIGHFGDSESCPGLVPIERSDVTPTTTTPTTPTTTTTMTTTTTPTFSGKVFLPEKNR